MTPLSIMLRLYEASSGRDAKSVASEIGIAESTMSRIKSGRSPNAETLARIIAWMVGGADGKKED